jgi:hypothetical protein
MPDNIDTIKRLLSVIKKNVIRFSEVGFEYGTGYAFRHIVFEIEGAQISK